MPRKRQPTDAVIEYFTTVKLEEAVLMLRVVGGLVASRGKGKATPVTPQVKKATPQAAAPPTPAGTPAPKPTGVRRARRGRWKSAVVTLGTTPTHDDTTTATE